MRKLTQKRNKVVNNVLKTLGVILIFVIIVVLLFNDQPVSALFAAAIAGIFGLKRKSRPDDAEMAGSAERTSAASARDNARDTKRRFDELGKVIDGAERSSASAVKHSGDAADGIRDAIRKHKRDNKKQREPGNQ